MYIVVILFIKAMAIAQNIRQQEDLILQSAVFKSVKPVNIQKIVINFFLMKNIFV
jgi:hypothetical protein